MTGKEVVAELKSGSLLAKVHAIVSEAAAEIANGQLQRKPLSIIEIRNIEFDTAISVAAALGVELAPVLPSTASEPSS